MRKTDWQQQPIKSIILTDKDYPKRLAKIKNPPKKLYYRGTWIKNLFKNCLAIVGARKMTRYGETVVERLVPDLVSAGVTIVSGFMYGIDSKAHQVCVDSGGRTIAVLGSGLNQLTPAGNDQLYSQILDSGGLVVSEYQAQIKARLWTFPQRNRIVAGLSKGVLVIEGGEKSGSLITAKFGFEQNKPVMAIPGPVDSSMAVGSNWLLKNKGVMVTTPKEILRELGIRAYSKQASAIPGWLSEMESKIMEELKREALEVDELARRLGKDIVRVGQTVSLMTVKGLIKEAHGKYSLSN